MKIAQFTNSESASSKIEYYNSLAIPPPIGDQTLTKLWQHPTLQIWWFNGTDCIENGGLARAEIEEDIQTLDTFEVSDYQELIDLGYLPQPAYS